jgi:TetR/AcrR family transcriptional regulator, transcriptional repressor for nem operon
MTGSSSIAKDTAAVTAKGRATRARIVDAAADLVYERGIAGTSLDDVGSAAGVGRSQLYHYFSDKSELVRAVIAHMTDQVLDAQEPYLHQLDSWQAWEAWRKLIVALQRQRDYGGCPLGSLASELADTDERARQLLVGGFDRWEAAFREGLEAMRAKGLLRDDANTDALALNVLAALQGGLLLCQTRRHLTPLEVALDGALANIRATAAPSPKAKRSARTIRPTRSGDAPVGETPCSRQTATTTGRTPRRRSA